MALDLPGELIIRTRSLPWRTPGVEGYQLPTWGPPAFPRWGRARRTGQLSLLIFLQPFLSSLFKGGVLSSDNLILLFSFFLFFFGGVGGADGEGEAES